MVFKGTPGSKALTNSQGTLKMKTVYIEKVYKINSQRLVCRFPQLSLSSVYIKAGAFLCFRRKATLLNTL